MLKPNRLPSASLLAPFPLVVVKGELFVIAGFFGDVLLGEPEELVSAASTLVVKVVVLEIDPDAAASEEELFIVCVEIVVSVDDFPETVVVLPTVRG
jgi:hypothetical protein